MSKTMYASSEPLHPRYSQDWVCQQLVESIIDMAPFRDSRTKSPSNRIHPLEDMLSHLSLMVLESHHRQEMIVDR